MPQAREVAAELRKLADHLEQFGDKDVPRVHVQVGSNLGDKQQFIKAVSLLPRPLTKDYGNQSDKYSIVRVTHKTDALEVEAAAFRYAVCRMVRPAQDPVWECEPLLSETEETALTA